MSTVTQCDFCGKTQIGNAGIQKVKLPVDAIPEPLKLIGSGQSRDYDACGACCYRVAAALLTVVLGDIDKGIVEQGIPAPEGSE